MSILCANDGASMGCDSPIADHAAELYSSNNEPGLGHYSPTTGLKMGSTIKNTKQVNTVK